MGSVTAQLQLLQQLEGQLLRLRKEKSFLDPAVKDVRRQFRATAEAVLLRNYLIAMVYPRPLPIILFSSTFPKEWQTRPLI